MNHLTSCVTATFVGMLTTFAALPALAQTTPPKDLIGRGQYIARAADCAACHNANLAGGEAIKSPIGNIFASNITPDKTTGIGRWTEAQFAEALRHGRAPGKGWLYPAMPYTSYTGMSDRDVKALWTYLQTVPAVKKKVPETNLGFPFVRPAMMIWNLLNLTAGSPIGAIPVAGEKLNRGRYLVETLGHCTTCHTPRNATMSQIDSRHLAGAKISGWYAPNITPDTDGIGSWSDADLIRFLKTGHNKHAVAAGDMGLVVSRSLSHLKDSDIAAMVAYLRKVPAVATDDVAPPSKKPSANTSEASSTEVPISNEKAFFSHDTTNGAVLYQGACASCHGTTGSGGAGPNLLPLTSVRSHDPRNLVQVIAKGVDVKTQGAHLLMPAFRSQMNDAQIASLANYVSGRIAGVQRTTLHAKDVAEILKGTSRPSWLIANARWLAWGGIVVLFVVLMLIIVLLGRQLARRRHHV